MSELLSVGKFQVLSKDKEFMQRRALRTPEGDTGILLAPARTSWLHGHMVDAIMMEMHRRGRNHRARQDARESPCCSPFE